MKSQYIPATFLRRFFAFVIDGFILSSFTAIIMKINPNLLIIVSFAYFILLDASKNQGTLGKQFLSLKIINQEGEKLTYLQAGIRHILKYFGILFFGIGYWGLPFRFTQKKAIVDRLSKTIVVREI